MTTEESVVENPNEEAQVEIDSHSEIKNYHDSIDASGSNFHGNVTVNVKAVNHEKSFVELSELALPTVRSWYHYKPDLTQLIEKLLDKGVLFLGGEIDQLDQLARTLAWQIMPILAITEDDSDRHTAAKIYEWKGLDNVKGGIIPLIENECESGVVILPMLQPETLLNSYSSLLDSSRASRKIIITTASNTEVWQTKLDSNQIIVETPSYRELFAPEYRREFIEHTFSNLEKNHKIHPKNLDAQISPQKTHFIHLCESLGSFDSIKEFIENIAVTSLSQPVEFRDVKLFAEEINDKLNRLLYWYDNLKPQDQLLCLLTSIFNSVSVEQLLELANSIVIGIWRPMQGSLAIFDHSHLKLLERYFTVQNFGSGVEKIEAVNFQIPKRLLNHAWDNQRRYLLALLPFCVKTIEDSVKGKAQFHYILYGSKVYRSAIRQDIASYLSWMGQKQLRAIETPLLHILSIHSYDARQTAARTLSLLYKNSDTDAILQLLDNWNHRVIVKERLESLLPELKNKGGDKAREYLQATIILTITEIFRQIPTDKLPDNLLDLFKKILQRSASKTVQRYIGNYFLPTFYLHHFPTAQTFTKRFITQSALSDDVISKALSYGEFHSPTALKAYFDYQIALSRQSQERDKNSKTYRIRFLSVTLGALCYLDYSKNRVLTSHQAFEFVEEILDKEHHPIVRESALVALVSLSSLAPEVVDEKFQYVIQSLTNEEREKMAEYLYSVYIRERRSREDGEEKLLINQEKFTVWIDTERPQMPVETTLSQWLEGANTVPSTRLAYKAESLILDRFDSLEQIAIQRFKEEREAKRLENLHNKTIDIISLDKSNESVSWYSRSISIPIGTRRFPQTREAITGILPEALKQSREMQNQMIERLSKDEKKKKIAMALASVLGWERHKPFLGVAFVLAVALLLWLQLP
ncbi:MAG: hypothetical protein AAGB12_10080 [Pseudomonadota bacterium]